jgi:methyl-accepting chemotaxis protein
MNSDDSKIAKVQTRFQELSTLASSLNTASDELTKVIGTLDEALKKLNVGLTVWVPSRVRGDETDHQFYDQDQIGYAKVSGTWGIVLRRIWGNEAFDDDHHEDGPWLFKDAPRELRLAAADKIPELIEALAKAASTTTREVQEKTKQVRELAAAIDQVASANTAASLQSTLAAASKNVATAAHLSYKLATTPPMSVGDMMKGKGKEGGK